MGIDVGIQASLSGGALRHQIGEKRNHAGQVFWALESGMF